MLQKMVMIVVALMLLLADGDIAKAARLARVSVARGAARRELLQ